MTFSITINETQHSTNDTSLMTLNAYTEWRNAECHYGECHFAECRGADFIHFL
jgi:hypothetical protein